jgi:ABC-type polysaccharide/polyol phosphate transport system ATPase subunit
MAIVEFQNVSKTFSRTMGKALLRAHIRSFLTARRQQPFYALKNVSFAIDRGESVAVIGSNGAGKSTLLALVAGLTHPDEGSLEVNGRVAALLDLGAGFHPDLTGVENVYLNASLMGLSRKRTNEVFDEIIDFSGVSDFISEPLRTYSSGMIVRLAFSVAVHCDPEILLVDEVLVVGDQAFQAKCREKIASFRQQGKTLLCVSHAPAMVLSLCDRALWLDHGELIMAGRAAEVLDAYGARTAAAQATAGL